LLAPISSVKLSSLSKQLKDWGSTKYKMANEERLNRNEVVVGDGTVDERLGFGMTVNAFMN